MGKRYYCGSCGTHLAADGTCSQAQYHAPARRAESAAKRDRVARRAREDKTKMPTAREAARACAALSLAEAARYEERRERARAGWRTRGQGRDLDGPTAPAQPAEE